MVKIPSEALQELRDNLSRLRPRDPERRNLVQRTAFLFDCSETTVYRQLAELSRPQSWARKDQGHARYPIEADFKRWVEIVAAMKLATRNQKGRHLSTVKAITLAEEGFYLEGRFEQIPKGVLKRSRCDRWMEKLGINIRSHGRPFPCVRFEAKESNECWQFDMAFLPIS